MENWRAAHAYPMHAILMCVRQRALRVDSNATTAQRLKRASSVELKLQRFPKMKLDRMQDIGGCRVIVKSLQAARRLRADIEKSRTKNHIHSQKDYVAYPKESGYRGFHIVFRYKGTKAAHSGLFVETQIRTRAQHAWATAVEVVGMFIGRSLKTGESHPEWDRFFQLAASEFSYEKGSEFGDATQREENLLELRAQTNRLNVFELLDAYSASAEFLKSLAKSEAKNSYFLIQLDVRETPADSQVFVWTYPQRNIEDATAHYSELENKFRSEKRVDVVLVAVESLKSLESAYPNYFADTKEFIRLLRQSLTGAKHATPNEKG